MWQSALLEQRPRDLEAIAEVPGIGQHKLTRYGQQFLDVLREIEAESASGENDGTANGRE